MYSALESRIRDIVEARDQGRWPLTRAVLRMGSILYGIAIRVRVRLYQKSVLSTHRLSCKVIAIGNLTAGGTGKTPMTLYLAQRLQQMGKRVVIISRGYKGAAERDGGLVSDGQTLLMSSSEAGDEPYMMAHHLRGIPVLVGRDRLKSSQQAIRQFDPDVIILDDGYQHLRLHRDLNLLLLDARHPFGNGYLLPRGNLREPDSAMQRADAIVLSRSQESLPHYYSELVQSVHPRPVFRAFHLPSVHGMVPALTTFEPSSRQYHESKAAESLHGRRVFAFCGLANNDSFGDTVRSLNGELRKIVGFRDHHAYRLEEMQNLGDMALREGCDCLVTSEKDFMRIPAGTQFPLDLVVLGVEVRFAQEGDPCWRFISRILFPGAV